MAPGDQRIDYVGERSTGTIYIYIYIGFRVNPNLTLTLNSERLESKLEGWHREIKELTTLGNVAQVIYTNIYIHYYTYIYA